MNTKYPLSIIAVGFLLCLSACNKNDNAIGSNSIVGKWYVNKIAIHITSSVPGAGSLADTTYTGSVFNSTDYFQFNSDKTASVSSSGDFTYSGKLTVTNGAGTVVAGQNAYTYTVSGDILTLKSTLLIPHPSGGGFGPTVDTIEKLDSSSLILRSMYSGGSISYTTDTYYTKAK